MNLTRLNCRCSGFGGQFYHERSKSFPVQFDVKKARISVKRKTFTSSLPVSVGVYVTDSGDSSTTIGHGFAKRDGEIDDDTANKTVTPLVDALRECVEMDAAAFHFPGHRRGAGAPPRMAGLVGKGVFAADLPELPELDNLHAAEGVIQEAQVKAAALFQAEQTWFLVNGSTCGIQAAVMASCNPGDYLILPRNAHMSAVSAMVLSGALPKYISPIADSTWGVSHGVHSKHIDIAIRQVQSAGGRVGAVLVVSPTYFGICSHVGHIATICHSHGVPLIVDEAHGAHFQFHEEFPQPALKQGADIAVQSTHKVLGSLTQSAMLHSQGSIVERERLSQSLQMLQSSSPSYILLASLDAARAHMDTGDPNPNRNPNCSVMERPLALAATLRQALRQIPGIALLEISTLPKQAITDGAIAGIDPLRITVGLWELGLTGFEADDILRLEHGVIAELPSLRSITFALSAGTSERDVTRLIESLESLSARFRVGNKNESSAFLLPDQEEVASSVNASGAWNSNPVGALSPREAFFAKWERVDAADAVGRVSAELLCPYPPGIPIVAPGEVFTQAAVDYLTVVVAKGGVVSGASDSSFSTARVICS